MNDTALESFLEKSLTKLADNDFAEYTGIPLALSLYAEGLLETALELQYLSSWSALELLLHHAAGSSEIIERRQFNKVRKYIRAALSQALAEGLLDSQARGLMLDKVGELNRRSAWRLADQFFRTTFAGYAEQDVTEEEFRRFTSIRNAIVHTGTAKLEPDKYVQTLAHEMQRLRHLLERVILALLNERPHLMDFSWRVMFGR